MIKRDDKMEKFMEIIREKWEPEKGNEHRYRHFFFSFFYDGLTRTEEFVASLAKREIGTFCFRSFVRFSFFFFFFFQTFCPGRHCFQGSLEDLLHRGHDLTRRFTSPRVETEIRTCPSVLQERYEIILVRCWRRFRAAVGWLLQLERRAIKARLNLKWPNPREFDKKKERRRSERIENFSWCLISSFELFVEPYMNYDLKVWF